MNTTESRYVVTLLNSFTNDLGEMTEMQLFGYLKNRPLLDWTPEQVLTALGEQDEVMTYFGSPLGSDRVTRVKIRRSK